METKTQLCNFGLLFIQPGLRGLCAQHVKVLKQQIGDLFNMFATRRRKLNVDAQQASIAVKVLAASTKAFDPTSVVEQMVQTAFAFVTNEVA